MRAGNVARGDYFRPSFLWTNCTFVRVARLGWITVENRDSAAALCSGPAS